MGVHTCNPSMQDAEEEESGVRIPFELESGFLGSKARPCLAQCVGRVGATRLTMDEGPYGEDWRALLIRASCNKIEHLSPSPQMS